jgi:hypothetical protein
MGGDYCTSAAPLTYWAWPPMREGCCWSDMAVVWCLGSVGSGTCSGLAVGLIVGSMRVGD